MNFLILLLYLPALALATINSNPITSPCTSTLSSLPTPKCKADNCLRALNCTQSGPSHLSTVLADCSSVLITTDHPVATITSYSTLAEATNNVFVTAAIEKRQIIASSQPLPTYAKPCTDFYAFSSACSCLGVTASVVTGDSHVSSRPVS
ncbi:uncharacterized protein RAG0_05913 [Rhynchosporium agropyri]|uniref:Uncharacterized protein n=1 Tax=Rhynchosporium agropyri TaxID=914238 RepID=A0A1E1KFD9_9HELO|nr:uncharacterized protein RAG0_05913 [Rhynchosporium agropyri]